MNRLRPNLTSKPRILTNEGDGPRPISGSLPTLTATSVARATTITLSPTTCSTLSDPSRRRQAARRAGFAPHSSLVSLLRAKCLALRASSRLARLGQRRLPRGSGCFAQIDPEPVVSSRRSPRAARLRGKPVLVLFLVLLNRLIRGASFSRIKKPRGSFPSSRYAP